MPTVFICINGKSYKHYILAFEKLRNLLCDFDLQNMNLKSITIHLEITLRKNFGKIFGNERKFLILPRLNLEINKKNVRIATKPKNLKQSKKCKLNPTQIKEKKHLQILFFHG